MSSIPLSSEIVFDGTNKTEPVTVFALLPLAIITCVSVGAPLNLLIAVVIIVQRRLHKPRHISWLGVTFSNLFAQSVSVNELIVFYLMPESKTACWIFFLLVGIPYASLLLNLLLGLIDRFVAITYPLWHKNKVSVKLIIAGQLTGVVLLSILFKTPYFWYGIPKNVSCNQNEPHGKIIVFTLTVLVTSCFIAQIVIYLKTKTYFLRHREGRCQSMGSLSQADRMQNRMDVPEQETTKSPEFFVHVGSNAISKLEIEAAWTLAQGVTSLAIISSPIFIVWLGAFYCGHVYDDCTAVTWMIPYFRELVLVHTVYNPIMYIWRSHEFSSAVKRKCCLYDANVT
ncbi:beta-1 adrenergic receptor-like [Daphnia carinata]|uniref:beta-1 adrenergic receptor-like n=1 Tax=Daphnia carinata TaxID=120202 RepID=UPI00257EF656|nr:beta-1 adrenergic receptor-like [Daphnia carinata]